jgi:WD40 repeat protein
LHKIRGHNSEVASVALSHDDKILVSGGPDNSTRFLNIVRARQFQDLRLVHNDTVSSVAFSPDSKILALSVEPSQETRPSLVKLIERATGEEIAVAKGGWGGGYSLAYSPDGSEIAWAGFKEGTVKLLDSNGLKPLGTLHGHKERVLCMAFSPDGKYLVTGGADRTCKRWDLARRQDLLTLPVQPNMVWSVAISPDGNTLATGDGEGNVKLWDLPTGRMRQTLIPHLGAVSTVVFSPDGKYLVSAAYDGRVRIWEVAAGTGEPQKVILVGPSQGGINAVRFSSDGRHLVTANCNGTIYVLRLRTFARERG